MALSANDLTIRRLYKEDFQQMFEAFNHAFSDYLIPVSLSFAQFENRFLSKLDIDFSLSAGAFSSNQLVGFIFTGTGIYEGKKVAYNGGTGVIPSFRGGKLTHKLYNFLFPLFIENNIEACVLEVLTNNEKAISVYNSLGFNTSKYFHCFRKPNYDISDDKISVKNIKELEKIDWQLFRDFSDYSPSFLDSNDVIKRNITNEKIIVFEEEGKIFGYAIFQPELGRISQLAVNKKFRRNGVGTSLISYINKNSDTIAVTAMNINSQNKGLIDFFKQNGFENQLNQYEMLLSLV